MLRHTPCTHRAEVGATIRELAGHADISTTIYTAVSDARLEHAITERARQRHGVSRTAAGH